MKVLQVGVFVAALGALLSCSALISDKRIDYGAGGMQVPKLDVPPDLTAPDMDERYKIPQGDNTSVATYSDYRKGVAAPFSGKSVVLPEIPGVQLERDGARRWLVVNDRPDKVWAVVKAFWIETGLPIKNEDQAAGVMETDWVENRAKIPQSAIRNVLGKVFDKAYSSGERDQYLTRLERSKDGPGTEIYIGHRGIVQVFSEDKTISKWQARANDPELEAIMLQRLMVRFGAGEEQAASAVAVTDLLPASSVPAVATNEELTFGQPPEPVGTASLRETGDNNVIIVLSDAFDKSWRRAGLAIESAGLKVEDKDREKGIYFLGSIKIQSAWREKLKFWKKSEADKSYRVNVKSNGAICEISVTDHDGVSSKVTKQVTEEIYKNINQ